MFRTLLQTLKSWSPSTFQAAVFGNTLPRGQCIQHTAYGHIFKHQTTTSHNVAIIWTRAAVQATIDSREHSHEQLLTNKFGGHKLNSHILQSLFLHLQLDKTHVVHVHDNSENHGFSFNECCYNKPLSGKT